MTPIIRTLNLLSLGALVALGCASTSTVTESEPPENATKAPQEANRLATVDFPEAMPPVRPATFKRRPNAGPHPACF